MFNFADLFDLAGCPCPDVFERCAYPWEVVPPRIPAVIDEVLELNPGKYKEIAPPQIWVGEGTTIADTAVLVGPALIGANCEIRPNAYVRGNVIVGDGVVLGNATEIKQAIVFSRVQLPPHYNYVGDSILGGKVHLGGPALLSRI